MEFPPFTSAKGALLGKRPRPPVEDDDDDEPALPKTGTAAVVEAALAAEAAAKAARSKDDQPAKKKKGVSFAETDVERAAEEVATAAARRALQRKGGARIGDTELVDAAAAERLSRGAPAAAADEGEFEPFHLDAEREAGHFDADGHYVEDKQADAEAEEDAWLEGVEVDERHAAKCAREAAAEASKPARLSEAEMGRMKLEISELLQPGETVLRALRRMSGKPAAGSGRGRPAPSARASAVDPAQRAAFERLTELSSSLMAYGEYDVYSAEQASFARAAAAHGVAPRRAAQPAQLDMFGDDDSPAPAPAAAAQPPAPSLEWERWSAAALKRFLELRGCGAAARGALEKAELVAAAREAAARAALRAPDGYAFDAARGLFASADGALLFDLASGLFSSDAAAWYRWDGAAFVPV